MSHDADQIEALARLERQLDPSRPERNGVRVIGYGEISVALTWDEMPGMVVKRMAGFADADAAESHARLVERYVRSLRAAGLRVVPTDVVVVARADRSPIVAVVQPLLDTHLLGHRLLHTVDDATMHQMLRRVLDASHHVVSSMHGGDLVAVDAQLSNWWFERIAPDVGPPTLIDVGTPFVRRDGRLLLDRELILSAAPRWVRPYFRWDRTVEKYQDDYFDLRTVAIDLLGNFYKEGASQRLTAAIPAVNAWLTEHAAPALPPVTRDDVDRYYRSDARLLELYLRLRRVDRLVQRRLLRRRYDFVLPGRVVR